MKREPLAKLQNSSFRRRPESIESTIYRSRKWIIRFAHPSGRPVGVQSASALVRLKTCRNDGVLQVAQDIKNICVYLCASVVPTLLRTAYNETAISWANSPTSSLMRLTMASKSSSVALLSRLCCRRAVATLRCSPCLSSTRQRASR